MKSSPFQGEKTAHISYGELGIFLLSFLSTCQELLLGGRKPLEAYEGIFGNFNSIRITKLTTFEPFSTCLRLRLHVKFQIIAQRWHGNLCIFVDFGELCWKFASVDELRATSELYKIPCNLYCFIHATGFVDVIERKRAHKKKRTTTRIHPVLRFLYELLANCELARHTVKFQWADRIFMFYTQGRMSSILNKDEEWAAEKKVGRILHNSTQLSLFWQKQSSKQRKTVKNHFLLAN